VCLEYYPWYKNIHRSPYVPNYCRDINNNEENNSVKLFVIYYLHAESAPTWPIRKYLYSSLRYTKYTDRKYKKHVQKKISTHEIDEIIMCVWVCVTEKDT
jgi:hypothetical protein